MQQSAFSVCLKREVAGTGQTSWRTKLRQFGEVHKKGERKVCDFFPFSLFLTSETPAENLFGIANIRKAHPESSGVLSGRNRRGAESKTDPAPFYLRVFTKLS